MYRALTWWVLETGTDPQDAEAVAEAGYTVIAENA